METLVVLSALFALVGVSYAIYDTLTHDKKAKHHSKG